jgi:predicted transcriptional regulator
MRVYAYIDEDTHEKVKTLALINERSASSIIAKAIREYVKSRFPDDATEGKPKAR